MKSRKYAFLAFLTGLALLLALFPSGTLAGAAQGLQQDTPPEPPTPEHIPGQRTPKEIRQNPGKLAPYFAAQPAQTATSGGPDDFGYTWTDTISFNWVDARSKGTNSNITGDDSTGQLSIGFSFKFYGQTYTSVNASTNGILVFGQANDGCCGGFVIPNPSAPNNVIAPYWDDLVVGGSYNPGAIYTYNGGTAPNRYFVVEWYSVTACCNTAGTDYKTFEAILYENGNIKFQYQTLNGTTLYSSVGIENATGLDGLQILHQQAGLTNGKTYLINYPGPSARISTSPLRGGSFVTAGNLIKFPQTIENTGDLGSDTYDLFTSSPWPIGLYQADGTTPLTDSNNNGALDTGPLAQGTSKTIMIKVEVPATAKPGDAATVQLTIQSSLNPTRQKVVHYQVAVPAPFAQSYDLNDGLRAQLIRPTGTKVVETAGAGSPPAVATAPNGNILQAWTETRTNGSSQTIRELFYTVIGPQGDFVIVPTRLTDYSTSSTPVYDNDPAVAVAPNGNMAITWYHYVYNPSNQTSNYNIFYTVLDPSGVALTQPANLTQNSAYGAWNATNVPRFYQPNAAATTDSRFILAWNREVYSSGQWYDTVWYALRDGNGGALKAPTQFDTNACSYQPSLATAAGGGVYLVENNCGKIGFGKIDSNGAVVKNLTLLTTNAGNDLPDLVQLPSGNLVLAWTHYTISGSNIEYSVLNNGFGLVKGITDLPQASLVGDNYVSVTFTGSDRAVLTWNDTCCDYQPNLYYALINDSGGLLTNPMIFLSDNTNQNVDVPFNGQGNTYLPLDSTPPNNPTSLNSSDHTVGAWSNDNTIAVSWSGASDADSGVGGYSILWDNSPSTLPDTEKDVEANVSSATSSALADGTWYFHLRTVDNAGNWAPGGVNLGPFLIDTTPPVSKASSPPFALGSFVVSWNGEDTGSGIASYDVFVKDGASGAWAAWVSNTTLNHAMYTGGVTGHIYYFRSRAHDKAGNIETELPANGDTQTTVAAYEVSGKVLNSRGGPIYNAMVTASPAALNAANSDVFGSYSLFFQNSGTYDLAATRSGFGGLPPIYGLNVNTSLSGVDFVLPPAGQSVSNWGFESGTLSGWSKTSGISASAKQAAAHTGHYGLQISVPGGTTGVQATVIQTITVNASLAQPTLSLMFKESVSSPGDKLLVEISSPGKVVTHTVALNVSGWNHAWFDLSGFLGKQVTLRFGFASTADHQVAYLDEISVGENKQGAWVYFLPEMYR